jgi:Ca-activated chloride channel family protein
MKIIKRLNISTASLLVGVMVLVGCSSDPTLRSHSYADAVVNVPSIATASSTNADSGSRQTVSVNPTSTVIVETSSNHYGNLRRTISHGEIPAAVRLTEWLNYFSYDYPKSDSQSPLSAKLEIAPAPWNPSSKLMLIGVSALPDAEAPANNIVVLVDISEGADGSAVVALVKNTLKELKDKLRPQDKISLVNFSASPEVALEPTSGEDKSEIKSGISNIDFGQASTASSAIGSLNLAYTVLENSLVKNGNNYVLLITDGDLSVNENGLKALEKTIARKKAAGMTLSTLVFNTHNYNYQTMQRLADVGGGIHAYIDTPNEANRALDLHLTSNRNLIAQPTQLQVTFNPTYVKSYRFLGYEKNDVKTISQDKSMANAIREGQSFTAMYEIDTIDANITPELPQKYYDIGHISIQYKLPNQAFNSRLELPIIPSAIKSGVGKASKDFAFASAVAAFALKIKKDSTVNNYSYDDIIELAERGVGSDKSGLRDEFVRLLESVKALEEGTQ